MPYTIEFEMLFESPINRERLTQAVTATLKHENASDKSSLMVVISDNEYIQELNEEFRDVDSPTDVLSFPADPLPDELLAEIAKYDGGDYDEKYLGDIVIAYPYASSQAEKLKHSVDDSLCLLAVHGTLHLLGYDHDTPDNRAKMWAVQAAVLNEIGVPLDIVPALEVKDDDNQPTTKTDE